MELAIFLVSLFLLLFLGIPICLVLVLCSVVLMYHSGMWDSMIIPQAMLDGANNYPLMAIPFFVFAGEIMAVGGRSCLSAACGGGLATPRLFPASFLRG